MTLRPTIIVLAAGPGSRFGGSVPKLAQAVDAGTVLGLTLDHAVQTRLPVVVVTTPALAPLAAPHLATRDIVVLDAAESARGLGAAVAAGVAASSDAPGWLMLPGDMPLVRPDSLLAVAAALEQHPVAYAQYRGQRAFPVAFAAELYSELIVLAGDDALRRLGARYPAHEQAVDDAGVLLDVDTPDDLATLRRLTAAASVDTR